MRTNVRAYNLFYKYLLSYVVILLVPLIILGIFIYVYFIGIIKQDVIANNMNKLERIRYVIDDHIRQIQVISEQMYYNNVSPFFFDDDPLASRKIIADLRNYILTNNFISDILYYNHGDRYIYSSTSSYELPLLLNKIYHYEGWNEAAFIRDLNAQVTPIIRPMEKIQDDKGFTKRYVTFVYPLSSGGSRPTQSLLFLVSENAFQDLLKDTLKDYGGNTLIMDNTNRVVASLNEESVLQEPDFQEILNSSQDGMNQTVMIDRVSYILSTVVSSDSNWKYVTLVPVNQIMKKVTSVKLILIYLLSFILLVGGGVIYFLMILNYRPIFLLKKFTDKIWTDHSANRNELTSVQHAFEFLNTQNNELYARLEDYATVAKEHLLFQLLKGNFHSREELLQSGQSLGIVFTKPWFRVVTLNLSHVDLQRNELHSVDAILQFIEQALPEDVEGYARDHTDQKNIVLILSSEDVPDQRLEQIAASIQHGLKAVFGIVATVGVGGAYQEVDEIPKSYLESMTAIDYRLVKGTGQIIFSNEFGANQLQHSLPSMFSAEKLKLYIKQGDFEQIDRFLLDIIHFLKNDKPSMFEAKMVCFEIIKNVVAAIEETNKELSGARMEYPNVFLLSDYETVDELIETVKKLSYSISAHLQKMKQDHKVSLIDQMIDYLHINCTDCDFTIQQMADDFKMSQAHVSQYFKEHTQSNILDYVTNLKLDKAKELLVSSHMSIKDLALEVGYYNVNSFIRRFKQVIGMTPGEYRKKFATH